MSENYETGVREQTFIMLSIVLLIFSQSLVFLFDGTVLGSDSFTYGVLISIYLTSIFLAFRNRVGYAAAIRQTWLLWVLVAFCILSVFWATLPALTFRRSIALVFTTAYGVYLADRVNLAEMVCLLAKVFAILIAINLFVVFVFPEYGIHHSRHFGAWRGFFSHKNTFGLMMFFASLIYFVLALQDGQSRGIYWFGFAVSVGLILASHSQTSFLSLVITCGCTPFLRAIRWSGMLSKAFYISGFLFTAFSSYVIAINIERITAFFGRDATFTGRTDIWRDGFAMIMRQPWIGYGFGSEWVIEPWGFTPAWHPNLDHTLSLHNGYLELLAQVGWVGMVLYGIFFVFVFIRAVLLVQRSKGMLEYWPLYYLIFFFVYNLFEGEILRQNNFIWIIFVVLSVWLTSPLPKGEV